MDLSTEQLEEIEQKLAELESLDPADLPAPAAELVSMLSRILDEGGDSG